LLKNILYATIPRYIEDGNMRLRLLSLFDAPFLCDGFRSQEISAASGFRNTQALSWLSVWWWIKKTFAIVYCIEIDSERIGFIGLYNLQPGESAETTLVIFDKAMRRHGYGSRAFNLFLQTIKGKSLVEMIIVKVKADNHISASFWHRRGFKEISRKNDIQTMHIDLNIRNKNVDGHAI
jgi:RimJ/RimL family protein N-acetyltransferase